MVLKHPNYPTLGKSGTKKSRHYVRQCLLLLAMDTLDFPIETTMLNDKFHLTLDEHEHFLSKVYRLGDKYSLDLKIKILILVPSSMLAIVAIVQQHFHIIQLSTTMSLICCPSIRYLKQDRMFYPSPKAFQLAVSSYQHITTMLAPSFNCHIHGRPSSILLSS